MATKRFAENQVKGGSNARVAVRPRKPAPQLHYLHLQEKQQTALEIALCRLNPSRLRHISGMIQHVRAHVLVCI